MELYRLTDDLAEASNLAKDQPDIVKELRAKLDAWKATLPTSLPADCLSNIRQSPGRLKASPKGEAKEE